MRSARWPGNPALRRPTRRRWLVAALLALVGCAQAPAPPAIEIPPFHTAAAVPVDARLPADVLALDPAIRAYLRQHVDAEDPRGRLLQLVELMRSPRWLGLRYSATATRTAAQTFHQGDGNCLALSALFVAAAREVGLDARFQDVELLPSWRQDGDVFVIERHINAAVMIGGRPLVVDFLVQDPGSATRSRLIPDRTMAAQYFNNLGVEQLAAGRLAQAYGWFRRSIETAPEVDYLWTNHGVALARNGQRTDAEFAYHQALLLAADDAVALNNLAGLYAADGRSELARSSLARVERLRLGNPYYRYWLADRYLRNGDHAAAIRELQAAIALKPDDAAFHFALTRVYLQTGALPLAERSFGDARRYATDASVRAYYEAQYPALLAKARPAR